jgi:transcriptional regulator NrdR family protein
MPPSKAWILNERDKAIGVVQAALDAGVRLIDTADLYAPTWNSIGHNEILVMEALRNKDTVAYVRYASVYKDFAAASDFADFIEEADRKKS